MQKTDGAPAAQGVDLLAIACSGLDAPPEILFARKSEGTLELLERRRREYLQLRDTVEQFVIVDATQSEDEVTKQVSDLILDFYTWKKMRRRRSLN